MPEDSTMEEKQAAIKKNQDQLYKDVLLKEDSPFYIKDFKLKDKKGKSESGSDAYSSEQLNRFRSVLNDPEKFVSIQSSVLSRTGSTGLAPINWSEARDLNGNITDYAMQKYNPYRGDTLLSPQELLKASEDWKKGVINQNLLDLSRRSNRSPLSIINDAIRSPLTPQNVPTFTLNSLSETPLGSSNAPISALEGARMLVQAGFPPKGAAWLSGNIQQESSWDGQQERWDDVGADAAGIVSWRASRIDQIEAIGGKRMEEMTNAEQVQAMITEMKQTYPEVYKTFTNPYATDRSLKRASEEYWVYGEEGDRYRVARQVEALMRSRIPDSSSGNRSSSGALTYKNNKSAYLAVGDFIVKQLGFRVAEHGEFGRVGKHSKNSFHYYNEAFDLTHQKGGDSPEAVAASIEQTRKLKVAIRKLGLFKEVIGPGDWDPNAFQDSYQLMLKNHSTHLHTGGLIRIPTQDDFNFLRSSMQ